MLVATPGRLVDHLRTTHSMRLANVSWLVLDEADRLLDRGFTENLKEVLSELDKQRQLTLPGLPSRRQTILCSATLDGQVHALAKRTLDRPVRVDGRHHYHDG